MTSRTSSYLRVAGWILASFGLFSARATIHVAPAGNDANDGLSWATPKASISVGVTTAVADEHSLVLVSNGVYNVNIEIPITNALTVAAYDPDASQTVLQRTRFLLQHADAMVRGFTIENAYRGAKVEAGTVSGCIIRNNENALYGCGIWMTGGVVTNCLISDNYLGGTHGSAKGGTGVYMQGGLLVDSIIEDNVINTSRVGAGVRADGGMIDRCVIRGNTGEGGGAGVYLSTGAELRNSLVIENSSRQEAGGVYAASGFVENCTISRNVGAGECGGLYLAAAGAAVNTIAFENYGGSIAQRNVFNNGGIISNSCAKPLPAGIDNFDAPPQFADPENGDYRLRPGSPAIDAGVELDWMAQSPDLDGADRIIGSGADVGAYEAEAADSGALRVNFLADLRRATAPAEVVFTAAVNGENLAGLTYWWDFGNGTLDGAGLDVVTNSYPAGGIYTVSLSVSNALAEGDTVIKDRHIVCGPLEIHVSPEGASTPPYGDWNSALSDIHWAFENAGSNDTIYLAGRDFSLTRTLAFDASHVTIKGGYEAAGGTGSAGTRDPDQWPTRITRDPAVEALRIMNIECATNAVLEDIRVEGGRSVRFKSQLPGSGLAIADSVDLVFTRCRVRDNTAVGYGGGIYSVDSTVVFHAGEISLNSLHGTGWGHVLRGGGAYISGGEWTISDSVLGGNNTDRSRIGATRWDTREQLHGGGLYFDGGTHRVFNCAIYGNNGDAPKQHATVLHKRYGGGIYLNNGTVTVENSTIVGNSNEGIRRVNGSLTVTDSILWDNVEDVVGTVAVQYCDVETGEYAGSNGNISADPQFVRGLYLAATSACRNAGSDFASAFGLDTYTTQTNGTVDTGTVDLGVHYADGLLPAYADLFVAEDGDDGNGGASPGDALRTVGRALALARDGTHIHIGTGHYNPASGETFPLVLHRPGLHLIGAGTDQTTLDAGSTDQVITIKGIPVDACVADLAVSGGYTYFNYGGGIGIWQSRVLLDAIRVTENQMHGPSIRSLDGQNYGAGIGAFRGVVTLQDSVIMSNRTTCGAWDGVAPGGGLGIRKGEWTIRRTAIAFNETDGTTRSYNYGGGMLLDGGTHHFENLLVYSNRCNKVGSQTLRAYLGDGVYVHNTPLFLTRASFQNCTFAHNEGQGLYVADIDGGVDPEFTTLNSSIAWGNRVDVLGAGSEVITYNIGVTGPVSVAWSAGQELHSGSGNFVADPLFAGDGEYHLRSKAGRWTQEGWVQDREHSPCIDAGDRAIPVGDEPQPNSNRINLGAYGGTEQASLSIIPGTLFLVR